MDCRPSKTGLQTKFCRRTRFSAGFTYGLVVKQHDNKPERSPERLSSLDL